MRHKLGLDLPERRIGLSAHDFAQALGAKEVFLTRAAKLGGAPTVPSRFVQRLAAVAARGRVVDALVNNASTFFATPLLALWTHDMVTARHAGPTLALLAARWPRPPRSRPSDSCWSYSSRVLRNQP